MFPTPWCTDHLTSYDMCLCGIYAIYVCYVDTVIVAGLSRLCSLLVAGSDEEVGRVSLLLHGFGWVFVEFLPQKCRSRFYHISRFKKLQICIPSKLWGFPEVPNPVSYFKDVSMRPAWVSKTKKKRRLRFEGHGISTSKGWLRALFENRCLTIIFPNNIIHNIYIYINIYTYFCHLMGIPPFSDTWRLIDLGYP